MDKFTSYYGVRLCKLATAKNQISYDGGLDPSTFLLTLREWFMNMAIDHSILPTNKFQWEGFEITKPYAARVVNEAFNEWKDAKELQMEGVLLLS